MGIQIDSVRSLEALRLVTFSLLIEYIQLNTNIWIISRNSPNIQGNKLKCKKKNDFMTSCTYYQYSAIL